MDKRLDLHSELILYSSNAYFQPPSNVTLQYPCIIYRKSGVDTKRANNKAYVMTTEYQLTVIDKDPDGRIPEELLEHFSMCEMGVPYTFENLYHTPITLYY